MIRKKAVIPMAKMTKSAAQSKFAQQAAKGTGKVGARAKSSGGGRRKSTSSGKVPGFLKK